MVASDITVAEAAQIDKMNVASQRADLGTVVEEIQVITYANSASIITMGGFDSGSIWANASRIDYNTGSIVQIESAGSAQDALITANSASIVQIESAGSSQDSEITWNSASIVTLDGNVGTIRSGSHDATLADVDASSIEIETGTTSIVGWIVDVYHTGSSVTYHAANSGSNLAITPTTTGSWAVVAADDRVNWIVF